VFVSSSICSLLNQAQIGSAEKSPSSRTARVMTRMRSVTNCSCA
jgi:hypothetical protein